MKRKMAASISEIATAAGVSVATVSRVINNTGVVRAETCRRVYDTLEAMNIRVDDAVTTLNPVGKLILFNLPFDLNPFFNEIYQGAKTSAFQHGYHLLINQEHININTYKKIEKIIKGMKVSGAIFLNHINPEFQRRLLQLIPFVQCCDYDEHSRQISSVGIDDFKTAKMVTDYIASIGRRKIAFLCSPLKYRDVFNRKQGFLQGLRDLGLESVDHWIVQLPEINYDMALAMATQILSQPVRPDAFFAATDILAAAVINAARRLNIVVPRDLVVVGYDNVEYSRITNPSITTVNHSKFQLGFTACELLAERIQNPNAVAQHISLPCELVIRESSSI